MIFHYFTINVVYSWLWILIFIRVLNRYKISKTIFLVDFLGDQNGQTRFLFVFSKKFLWHPKLGFFRVRIPLRDQRKIFGKKIIFEKNGFCCSDGLKKSTKKMVSLIFFYLLETQKYPEIFLMPFYAPGPFILKSLKVL